MDSMEKNNTIQTYFDRYFDGAPLPPCDLSKAKQEVSARSRGRVRKIIAGTVSSVAAAGVALLIGMAVLIHSVFGNLFGALFPDENLPSTPQPHSYLLADTTSTSASFSDLNGKYDVMQSFAPFTLADNADAQYTLYYADEREVLLRAELSYTDAFSSFRATVWCDLTEGEYVTKDFEEYRTLPMSGRSYRYTTSFIDGEYVSRAQMVKRDTEYVIDMTSPNNGALDRLVSMLYK